MRESKLPRVTTAPAREQPSIDDLTLADTAGAREARCMLTSLSMAPSIRRFSTADEVRRKSRTPHVGGHMSKVRWLLSLLASLDLLSCQAVVQDGAQGEATGTTELAVSTSPIQVYGAWSCGNDYCNWASARNMTDFDAKNHWLIDRGNGLPSVNLVSLAVVNPLKLRDLVDDAGTLKGVPRGRDEKVVGYFTSRNVRVSLAVGG